MGLKSRNKGKLGEQEAVQQLRSVFPDARSKRAGGESATQDRGRDLLGTPGFCIQVRRAATSSKIELKLSQAVLIAEPHELPIAMTRVDRDSWNVTMPAWAFVAILEQRERMIRALCAHVEESAARKLAEIRRQSA